MSTADHCSRLTKEDRKRMRKYLEKKNHKCKFYPTGNTEMKGYNYRTSEECMDDLFSLVNTGKSVHGEKDTRYYEYEWMCECGKTKWVKEK